MLIIVDNYDSFVHTLAGYVRALNVDYRLVRNDECPLDELQSASAFLLSPGPGSPKNAGISFDAAKSASVPVLGVCLGHQVIGEAFGGKVVRDTPVHGRTSRVLHDGSGVFADLPSPLAVARYHSLVVTQVPDCLRVTARTADGTVMGLAHRDRPITGVQFHPEAVQTNSGAQMVANFLSDAGFEIDQSAVDALSRRRPAALTPDVDDDFFSEPIQPAYPLPRPPSASQ